jgi:hypothetical protein
MDTGHLQRRARVAVRSVTRQQLTGASVERNRIVEKSIRILYTVGAGSVRNSFRCGRNK